MKKLLLITSVIALLALGGAVSAAPAPEIGLRAGLTSSPDQFHFGAHADLGTVLPPMRLVPNIEIGLGDHITLISLNGDLIYDFQQSPFGVGGELALQFWDHEWAGSDTELGLSALGDYRLHLNNGKILLLEAKVGLMDAPDFKFTVGYSFF